MEEDAYFVTIAAYLTEDVPRVIINYVTKQTVMVFLIQILAIGAFLWDYRMLNQF